MKRFHRFLELLLFAGLIMCLYIVAADAYVYPDMPSNWENLTVVIGSGEHAVSLPLSEYPDGSTWPGDKTYMTVAEAAEYGISVSNDIWLRGSQCCGFARYVYCAAYYSYSQDRPLDNSLAYEAGTKSSAFYEVGTLPSGYTAAQLKALMTQAQPGAVMRISGHSMVVMAIFNDGVIVYDANFAGGAGSNEVDVRKYTWATFADKLGSRGIETLQMPTYYPGYTYYINGIELGMFDFDVDYTTCGDYVTSGFPDTLNVRSEPDTYSSIVGTLELGTMVDVLCSYNNWYAIFYDDEVCWVYGQYLTKYDGTVWATFNANGGTLDYGSSSYTAGARFGTLASATKANRSFAGWYYGDTLITTDSVVPKATDIQLDAAWNVYEFQDVSENDWYGNYVSQGVSLGLISRDTVFRPTDPASRCEFVTVLGRYYERVSGTTITNAVPTVFQDVPAGSFYGRYVGWGLSGGIVNGTDSNAFSPNMPVTREQIACFLYRYAKKYGLISSYTGASRLGSFRDGSYTDDYAVEAMNWAISAGLYVGDSDSMLRPRNYASRAEMITIFVRFIGLFQ